MRYTGIVLPALVWLAVLSYSEGFLCYECSYSTQTGGDRRDCISDPEALHRTGRCNDTSYCVLAEQYDLKIKNVTSYFRRCLGKSLGNRCSHDYSHVMCYASCQGEFCNRAQTGNLYKDYIKQFRDGDPRKGSGASRLFAPTIWQWVIYITVSVLSGSLNFSPCV